MTFTIARRLTTLSRLWPQLGRTLVAGEWVGDKAPPFTVLNPATDEKIADVPDLGANEAVKAIEAGAQAQVEWANSVTVAIRAKVVRQWARLLSEHSTDLAHIISLENGKTVADANAEVASAVASLEWYAEEAKRTPGQVLSSLSSVHKRLLVTHQPVGLVGVITPWNFPLSMITRKVGAALAAGCAVVVKPAEDTPLSAIVAANLAMEAGLNPSLFSVVTSSKGEAIGRVLCEHPAVRQIGFTGSSPVGRLLYQRAAQHLKRVNLELGGNAAFVVFETANFAKALNDLLHAKFRCSGQTCITPNRILLHSSLHDEFLRQLKEKISQWKCGPGLDPSVQMGPLINSRAVEKCQAMVQDALAKGAKLELGGVKPPGPGSFYPPTILSRVSPQMDCVKNEIFGPIAAVYQFSTDQEALAICNDTDSGLAGYFYSQDMRQIWRVAEQMQVGMVGVNETAITGAEMPFGGVKHSGIGREGGPSALHEFMETKYTCLGDISH